jgi:RsiW-degrading membrane proteinase PrsW (M82 family)
MVFIILFLFLGGSYLYWRYQNTSNKKIFFTSPLALTLFSCISILTVTSFVVNQLPEPQEPTVATRYEDSIRQAVEKDPEFNSLKHHYRDFRYQYDFVQDYFDHLPDDSSRLEIQKLEKWYSRYLKNKDEDSSWYSLSHFGLGLIDLKRGSYTRALKWFDTIPHRLPYVNFCKGQCYLNLKKDELANLHFQYELEVNGGYLQGSVHALISQWTLSNNDNELKALFQNPRAQPFFTYKQARQISLRTLNPIDYLTWSFLEITNHVNYFGFIAAMAIASIWFIYLIRLFIFGKYKLSNLAIAFLGGVVSVFGAILLNDLSEIALRWKLTGDFLNDLIYSIVGIGALEEIVKILPFLLVLGFTRFLKEPLDYIVFASVSALGFSFVENLLYFQEFGQGIIHGRAYLSVIGHMIFSSMIAYGVVLSRFKRKDAHRFFSFILSFLLASTAHGLFDFLIFHKHEILFIIFFIFIVQVWIIIINNCLNNAFGFHYRFDRQFDRSRFFLTVSLTLILAVEYIIVGLEKGPGLANDQLYGSATSGGIIIGFFASNLSSFNLIKGYWRDVYFSSREKRGYGTLPGHSIIVGWFFFNSIRSHNYVGLGIQLRNDPFNQLLMQVLDPSLGIITRRIILFENNDPDPNWFLVELDEHLQNVDGEPGHLLIKLRYQNDSLGPDEDSQVFFRIIPDLSMLKSAAPLKKEFPSYGWAQIRLQKRPQTARLKS